MVKTHHNAEVSLYIVKCLTVLSHYNYYSKYYRYWTRDEYRNIIIVIYILVILAAPAWIGKIYMPLECIMIKQLNETFRVFIYHNVHGSKILVSVRINFCSCVFVHILINSSTYCHSALHVCFTMLLTLLHARRKSSIGLNRRVESLIALPANINNWKLIQVTI